MKEDAPLRARPPPAIMDEIMCESEESWMKRKGRSTE